MGGHDGAEAVVASLTAALPSVLAFAGPSRITLAAICSYANAIRAGAFNSMLAAHPMDEELRQLSRGRMPWRCFQGQERTNQTADSDKPDIEHGCGARSRETANAMWRQMLMLGARPHTVTMGVDSLEMTRAR